jgi:hypothetical protein
MSLTYKCPDCEVEMTLTEDKHICPSEECGKVLSIDEATELFDAGELVGLMEESEAEVIAEETEEAIVYDISEDVAALIAGETLSEEFADKAKVIMETAIETRVASEKAILEDKAEQYAEYIQESVREEMVEKVDGYLDHIVEQWVEENQIAIEAGIKTEMDESFVEGLAGLLKEHYIQAPEQRWDIVEGLAAKVDELEVKLDESMDIAIAAKKEVLESEKAIAFIKISEGLADTQKEKLMTVAEGIEAETAETFTEKLTALKESYFDGKIDDSDVASVTEEESIDESQPVDGMAEVLRLLARK